MTESLSESTYFTSWI